LAATLLDLNVLVALAWPNHVHHRAALAWFLAHRDAGWATCPVTESGFVRVSSNRRAVPEARTPREAVDLLKALVSLPGHLFWPDAVSFADGRHLALTALVGHRQVTDAHLVALALDHGGRVASFDRGLRELVPAPHRAEDVVALLA
jgi:hypothetical protein